MRRNGPFVLKLDVDAETWKRLGFIPSRRIGDLKVDLETALRNRVEVLVRIEEHQNAAAPMQ